MHRVLRGVTRAARHHTTSASSWPMQVRFPHKLMTGMCFLLLAAGSTLTAGSSHASANDAARLAEIRRQLHDYGTERAQALPTLSQIDDYIRTSQSDMHRSEARYLRVAALTELYFLATYERDANLLAQLATYMQVAPPQLDSAIRQAVALEAHAPFRRACARAGAILDLIPGGELVDQASAFANATRGGAAGRLVALRHLVDALTDDRVLGHIAEDLGRDPCATPAQCPDPLTWPSQARRRLDGLNMIGQWYARIRRTADGDDPLAQALVPEADRLLAELRKHSVPLAARVRSDHVPELPADRGFSMVPRATLELDEEGVIVVPGPRALLTAEGAVEVQQGATPEPLPVPKEAWSSRAHENETATALSPLCARSDLRDPLAVRPGDRASALMFSRLLQGLRLAGCKDVVLLCKNGDGAPRGLRIEPTFGAGDKAPAVQVLVRPAGVLVKAYGNELDCPQVRGEDGQRQMDWPRLDRLMNDRRRELAVFSYVGWAEFSDVAAVMARAAYDQRVRVQVP